MVFQLHRRTTLLAPFEKVVFHKLQIQVSLPLLKLNKSIPLYKEKGKLIHIYAMAIFDLDKISFKKNFPSGIAMWNKAQCVQFMRQVSLV